MSDQPVAIITGAGRGIGRAVALALARRQYRLVLVSRTEAQLQEVRARVGPALILSADVTRPVDVQQVVRHAVEQYGRIDALVNAAGFLTVAPLSEMNLDDWQLTLETNVSSLFYLARAAWPQFVQQRRGTIVSVSSPAAEDPYPGLGAYGAAKAAVQTLGLMLAREGAAHNIAVHTISPGATETEMFRRIATPQEVPAEQILSPEDVAEIAAGCVVGELRYTSGTVIHLTKRP